MILEELHRVSNASIKGAGARYTPGLDPKAPNLEIEDLLAPFHALGHGPELVEKLEELWKEIESTWISCSRTIDEYAPEAAKSFAHLSAACRRLRNSRPKKSSSLVAALAKTCDAQRKMTWNTEAKVREKEEALAKQEATDQKAKDAQSSGPSDVRTRLQLSAQDLAKHARALSAFRDYLNSPAGLLIERNSVVLLGTWGTGKTHFLCDITSHRMARGAPTLLVLTKDFAAGTDALAALCASTRLAIDIDTLLQSLNRLGAEAGERAILILDGVNESDRVQWRKALRSLRNKVKKFANLGLIVSCRRPFEDTLFPKNYPQQYVVLRHRGFTDQEFDAQAEFFAYYGLPLPEVPLLAEEFARPLALKIICEAFTHLPKKAQSKGFESLTSGQRGMTFVLERYVKQQAEEVSRRTGFTAEACWWLLKGGKQAGSPRSGITPLMAETLREFITTPECLQLIRAHLGKGQKNKAHQVLSALTAAGILAEDIVWRPDEKGGPLDVVRLPYQRFSDHLIARCLLSQLDTSNGAAGVRRSLRANKPLGRVFQFEQGLLQYAMPGWAEALIIEFPERTKNVLPQNKRELLAYLPKPQRELVAYFEPFLGGLFWRHPSAIGHDTDRLVGGYFFQSESESAGQTADALVALASKTNHPYSAARLYRNLAQLSMANRDLLWTEYLRRGNPPTTMDKVVQWIEQHPTKAFRTEVAETFIVLLSLGLTTVNRLLRDRITRCLVQLGEQAPAALFKHTLHSLAFNDPYVPERMLAAAFGVTMSLWRTPGNTQFASVLADFAKHLVAAMFAPRAPHATHHALRRDYALGVIHLAEKLSPALVPKRCRPYVDRPQKSTPSPFPQLKAITDEDCEDGKSAIHTDFGNYTIGNLAKHRNNYDFEHPGYKQIRRRIEWRIGNLGYKKSEFETIDRELGRESYYQEQRHEAKIDRYGKKYSWIAYFEMYGWLAARGLLQHQGDPRCTDCDLDPSFPKQPPTWTPPIAPIFGKRFRKPEKWLATGDPPDCRPLLTQQQICDDVGPWVLLNGYLSLREPHDHREVFTFLRGLLVKPKDIDRLKQLYLDVEYPGNRQIPEVSGGHYTFAGEIPWSRNFTGPLPKRSLPRSYIGKAFDRWQTRSIEIKVKRAWARLYELMPQDDFNALLRHLAKEKKEALQHSPYFAQFLTLIEAANEGIPAAEQFELGDFRHHPTPEEAAQGFRVEQRHYQRDGVRVEVPAWSYDWESYHSELNDQGGAEVPSPSLCWELDLSFQHRSFDLSDSTGRKATLYRRNKNGPRRSDFHSLYLREDLLRRYLQKSGQQLVWMMWGERQFDHSIYDTIRDNPKFQAVWQSHSHIHRAFEQYQGHTG